MATLQACFTFSVREEVIKYKYCDHLELYIDTHVNNKAFQEYPPGMMQFRRKARSENKI